MKIIQLTKNQFAIIDDEDYDRVNQHKWCASFGRYTFYAVSRINNKNVSLHRFILDIFERNILVDHIDRNGLNCTRSNMRICTPTQNEWNSTKKRNNKSGFKGVYWQDNAHKWRSRIRFGGKDIQVGYFDTKEDAAKAYDKKAIEYFGEFAFTNF